MTDRSYRLYHLGRDGRIRAALDLDFSDDGEALHHAQSLLESQPGVEIWQTNRLVKRIDGPLMRSA